jgi:3-hydroxyisobutyrate dehydrogenase
VAGTGHPVTVWNRSPVDLPGVTVAATPADAVRGADVVLVMLTDAPAVTAVLAEALPGLRPGACVAQMSTIAPDETRAVAATMPAGVAYVDAPVGGSVDAAGAGQLRIFAGGADEAVALARPVLDSLGTVVRCGGVGAGAARKLVANTALVIAVAAYHDALAVAGALGVDRSDALELLAGGPLGAAYARMTSTSASFAVALAAKDAHLALRAAPDARVLRGAADLLDASPTPTADIVALRVDNAGSRPRPE